MPDYLNDLNAMNEAEKVLKEEQKIPYTLALDRIAGGTSAINYATWKMLHATAAQRAEAILKILNLWTTK